MINHTIILNKESMGSKANFLLSLNLLLYVLSTTTCDTPSNSSSLPGLTPPSGGGAYVAPCPYNSSTPLPSGGGAYVAPCPRDALKLGVCANLVGKSVGAEVGNSTTSPCCTLVVGLADLEVAACFCTAIRADILGVKLDIPISLSLLLNMCGINPPAGFICA